jgi:hypothetical protein
LTPTPSKGIFSLARDKKRSMRERRDLFVGAMSTHHQDFSNFGQPSPLQNSELVTNLFNTNSKHRLGQTNKHLIPRIVDNFNSSYIHNGIVVPTLGEGGSQLLTDKTYLKQSVTSPDVMGDSVGAGDTNFPRWFLSAKTKCTVAGCAG